MSLIQEALDKTQNRIPAVPGKKQAEAAAQPHVDAVKGLGALDREVEKKIRALPRRDFRKPESKKNPMILFVILIVLFASGLMYWSQKRLETEAVPPLVVGIERHNIPSKTNAEMDAIHQNIIPPLLSSSDEKGLFFLSGIAWGGAQPYAVINGQILRAGEMVEKKALLQSIERDHVTLDYHGEIIQLAITR